MLKKAKSRVKRIGLKAYKAIFSIRGKKDFIILIYSLFIFNPPPLSTHPYIPSLSFKS